jgi:hypothetical protein
MSLDIHRNGQLAPRAVMIAVSRQPREDLNNSWKRFTLHAVHVPLADPPTADMQINVSYPRLAGMPGVGGTLTLTVPNLDVARVLATDLLKMLAQEGPEIIQIKP